MGGNEVVFVSKAIAIRGVTLVTNYLSPLISTLFLIRNLCMNQWRKKNEIKFP